jgi:hypothetical protein
MASPSDTIRFTDLGIDRRTLNGALSPSRADTNLALIGSPRANYATECRDPTNPAVLRLMKLQDVGPFRVRGLAPAVDALARILDDVEREKPDVFRVLSHVGMLCCRLVRGSRAAISNHSWGTAIDFTLEGKLDRRGDERTQRGLLEIHPIFNRHGFYWGAAFPTEDAMHFEASEQLIRRWSSEGLFGEAPKINVGLFSFGDRGADVEALQRDLQRALDMDVDADGVFGKDTRAAVMEFQRRQGLTVDGVVGDKTMKALAAAVAPTREFAPA